MRYLCYISKERVDSLFDSAFDGIVDGMTETAGAEKQLGGEVGLSSLIAWLKAGLTFGYKSSNTSQSTKRKSAISRLEAVISFIDKTGSVCDLERSATLGKCESIQRHLRHHSTHARCRHRFRGHRRELASRAVASPA